MDRGSHLQRGQGKEKKKDTCAIGDCTYACGCKRSPSRMAIDGRLELSCYGGRVLITSEMSGGLSWREKCVRTVIRVDKMRYITCDCVIWWLVAADIREKKCHFFGACSWFFYLRTSNIGTVPDQRSGFISQLSLATKQTLYKMQTYNFHIIPIRNSWHQRQQQPWHKWPAQRGQHHRR